MPKTPRFRQSAQRCRRPARVIEVLAFPAVQLLDVAGPLQVFATANDCRWRQVRRPTRSRRGAGGRRSDAPRRAWGLRPIRCRARGAAWTR